MPVKGTRSCSQILRCGWSSSLDKAQRTATYNSRLNVQGTWLYLLSQEYEEIVQELAIDGVREVTLVSSQ